MLTRRLLLKTGAVGGAALALPWKFLVRSAYAFDQSTGIPLFGTTLRGISTIPVAAPDLTPAPVTGVTHYTIGISQFTDQIVPASSHLGPTTLWGYQPARKLTGSAQKHLGGIIVGQKGHPIQITFRNNLPTVRQSWGQIHPLPVDLTVMGADGPQNRVATHLHGGLVPWISDGGPFGWWDPLGNRGESFRNNILNPTAAANEAEFYYPLNQSARFEWYHDHAFGITRLNAYAGIASGLIIRDSFEHGLIGQGLPDYIEAGGNEIPLVFQDKVFVGSNILGSDPTWTGATSPGSLWYPHTYEPDRWELEPGHPALPDPSCVPEFFADTMLVNGTAFPQVTVEARRYRLRLLNACNARFLNLQLYVDDGSRNGITLNHKGKPRNLDFVNAATGDSSFLQIGTEGGFLPHPVKVPCNVPIVVPEEDANGSVDPSKVVKSLLVAPAERPDLIVDFRHYAGRSVILYNDAPAPFPMGDDRYDYFPGFNVGSGVDGVGNPVNGTTSDGFGPNSRVLMRFNVVARTGAADKDLRIDTDTNLKPGLDPFLVPVGVTEPPHGIRRRFLSLNEAFDEYGRLIQILGNARRPTARPTWMLLRRSSMTATRRCGRSTTRPETRTRCISTW